MQVLTVPLPQFASASFQERCKERFKRVICKERFKRVISGKMLQRQIALTPIGEYYLTFIVNHFFFIPATPFFTPKKYGAQNIMNYYK